VLTKIRRETWAIVGLVLFASAWPAAAQEPAYVAVKAGRVITVSGEEYAPGVIVIEDGMITAVGSGLEFPKTAEVIDAHGQTVMPGFINVRTRYGLRDFERSGVSGDRTASEEVYVDTIPFDELVQAGFTTVSFVPTGSDIPGMASVYRTAAVDGDEQLVDKAAYLDVNTDKPSVLRDALKKAKDEIEKVEKARKEWEAEQKKKAETKKDEKPEEGKDKPDDKKDGEDGKSADSAGGARWSDDGGDDPKNGDEKDKPAEGEEKKAESVAEEFKPPPIDPKYQPLVDLLQKKDGARFMVRLSSASDLLHLEEVLKPYEELWPTLYLATRRTTDYYHVVENLGKHKAQVVIRPWLHEIPYTYNRYNLIDDLTKAGCTVSVVPRDDTNSELRRFRSHLAELVRAGLDKAEAYKMLTLHPAQAIGMDDTCGSIEKKRRGDLVFFDGDPLDPHSKVQRVMISGTTVYQRDENK